MGDKLIRAEMADMTLAESNEMRNALVRLGQKYADADYTINALKDDVKYLSWALQRNEALLRELIDIEGPQPGTCQWAEKVKDALASSVHPEQL